MSHNLNVTTGVGKNWKIENNSYTKTATIKFCNVGDQKKNHWTGKNQGEQSQEGLFVDPHDVSTHIPIHTIHPCMVHEKKHTPIYIEFTFMVFMDIPNSSHGKFVMGIRKFVEHFRHLITFDHPSWTDLRQVSWSSQTAVFSTCGSRHEPETRPVCSWRTWGVFHKRTTWKT